MDVPNSLQPRAVRLGWLIGLRWLAVLGQVTTIGATSFVIGIELPLLPLSLVLVAEILSNASLHAWNAWRKRRNDPPSPEVQEQLQLLVMVLDTVLLVFLLQLTGGLANPFAAFLTVHIVMAAVLLPQALAFAGAGFTAVCLTVLVFTHRPLPALAARPDLVAWGTAVALSLTLVILVYFVTRVTRALAAQTEELARERERQSRTERLEAPGTLPAGAAPEPATPLSTIAVVAKELEVRLASRAETRDEAEDARLMRTEVARCRRILDRMSTESGDKAGEAWARIAIGEVIDDTLDEFPSPDRVEVELDVAVEEQEARVPREALSMALRNLLSNAVDATPGGRPVLFTAVLTANGVEFVVRDTGVGMDEEGLKRATDPFFTTKEVGEGMGLGLFLARSVTERLGGELVLESATGRGTTVRLRLPLDPEAPPRVA